MLNAPVWQPLTLNLMRGERFSFSCFLASCYFSEGMKRMEMELTQCRVFLLVNRSPKNT